MARREDENESGAGGQADVSPDHGRGGNCCGAHIQVLASGISATQVLIAGTESVEGHVPASPPGRISHADRLKPAEPRTEHERRRDRLGSDSRCDESSGPFPDGLRD